MFTLRTRPLFSSSFSLTFSPPKRPLFLSKSKSKPSSSHRSISMASSKVIEHIVLFKVKPDTEPSKLSSMLSGLNGLASLDPVLHLTAGPIHRNGSTIYSFTHMLHSRYASKDDLAAYSAHPSHMGVVKESVLPVCDDIMAVDWVADALSGDVSPKPGSAIRVSFLKVKEGLGEEVKGDILGVIGGLKESFGAIEQITCGENFSPARAKGFSIASLAVFPGVKEMEAVDSNEELVRKQKEKVKDRLEGVIVVDYVVPSQPSASL